MSAGLCEDVDIREANMFWAAPGCPDFNPNNPFTSDDIEAMTSLYGPYASFEAVTETYGGVPLEVLLQPFLHFSIEQCRLALMVMDKATQ